MLVIQSDHCHRPSRWVGGSWASSLAATVIVGQREKPPGCPAGVAARPRFGGRIPPAGRRSGGLAPGRPDVIRRTKSTELAWTGPAIPVIWTIRHRGQPTAPSLLMLTLVVGALYLRLCSKRGLLQAPSAVQHCPDPGRPCPPLSHYLAQYSRPILLRTAVHRRCLCWQVPWSSARRLRLDEHLPPSRFHPRTPWRRVDWATGLTRGSLRR